MLFTDKLITADKLNSLIEKKIINKYSKQLRVQHFCD